MLGTVASQAPFAQPRPPSQAYRTHQGSESGWALGPETMPPFGDVTVDEISPPALSLFEPRPPSHDVIPEEGGLYMRSMLANMSVFYDVICRD